MLRYNIRGYGKKIQFFERDSALRPTPFLICHLKHVCRITLMAFLFNGFKQPTNNVTFVFDKFFQINPSKTCLLIVFNV